MFSRFSRPAARLLSTTAPTKTSTGLVGLKVHPDPIPALIAANQNLLGLIKAVPETSAYRTNITAIANFRINAAESAKGETYDERCLAIENEINCGQIEELIIQAEDEVSVIETYVNEKMWENCGDAVVSFEKSFKD